MGGPAMELVVSRRNARAAKPVPRKFLRPIGTRRLFRAEPALADARHISAVGCAERPVSGRTRVHVTLHLRLRRRNRGCGLSLRCRRGGRVGGRRRRQAGWDNRRADRRIRRSRGYDDRCRWWPDRRRRMQSGFRVGHWRHRSRQPVEPQQDTAEGNDQHRAINRKPHRFAPASDEPMPNSRHRH